MGGHTEAGSLATSGHRQLGPTTPCLQKSLGPSTGLSRIQADSELVKATVVKFRSNNLGAGPTDPMEGTPRAFTTVTLSELD